MSAELTRLHRLRAWMLRELPFWGWLAAQVRLVPAPGLGAFAATDALTTIWFDPTWTRHLSDRQLGFVLAHEVGHMLLLSLPRRRWREPWCWNQATDYAINRIVASLEVGGAPAFDLPEVEIPGVGPTKVLFDKRWDGFVAEAIYVALREQTPEPPSMTPLPWPGGQDGSGEADPGGSVSTGSHGAVTADHGGGIDLHAPDVLSDAQVGELRQRRAAAAEYAAQVAAATEGQNSTARGERAAGTSIGRDQTRLAAGRRPRTETLRRSLVGTLEQAGAQQLARRRRHRLGRWLGLDLPGLASFVVEHLAVVVDVSASMEADLLADLLAAVALAAERCEQLTLLTVDAAVREVHRDEAARAVLRRGLQHARGGTDLREGFAALERVAPLATAIVVVTDLRSPLPAGRPASPVIWLTPPHAAAAPWGQQLRGSCVLAQSAAASTARPPSAARRPPTPRPPAAATS